MGAGHLIMTSVTINKTYTYAARVIALGLLLRILWDHTGHFLFFFLFPSFGRAVQNDKEINTFFSPFSE